MFIVLSLLYKKYRKFYLMLGFLLVIFRFLLYGPIYSSLGVSPDGGKTEMLGIPMNQIAYIYHNNATLTKEERELLDKFADKKTWEEYYSPTNFNSLKTKGKQLYMTWANENFNDIITLYIKYGFKYPFKYLRCDKPYLENRR